jgi:glutamate synthase domain-containing protein 2
MSYGALSKNAILALNTGARRGGFYHNTGEGGVSPYHLRPGGDLMWQIGTGYFGCRTPEGEFDIEAFARTAAQDSVKLIEVKLSQGAKPGHGGILPAVKVTPEISRIRGVPMGKDVLSPPGHSAFSTPRQMMDFLNLLRETCGKPVGIKLCVGSPVEVMAMCKAMRQTGFHPDFISVDGGEGGTGAAPLEFSNSVGMPLSEGLVWMHNCLVGFDVRDRVRVIASGKITSGFDMMKRLALGADLCASARAMMLSLGCIQARRCNSNECPVGVATQKDFLVYGLDVESKAERVHNYHDATVHSLLELVGAAGLTGPDAITPRHVMRRVDSVRALSYAEIYPFLERGALLTDPVPPEFEHAWMVSSAERF